MFLVATIEAEWKNYQKFEVVVAVKSGAFCRCHCHCHCHSAFLLLRSLIEKLALSIMKFSLSGFSQLEWCFGARASFLFMKSSSPVFLNRLSSSLLAFDFKFTALDEVLCRIIHS